MSLKQVKNQGFSAYRFLRPIALRYDYTNSDIVYNEEVGFRLCKVLKNN